MPNNDDKDNSKTVDIFLFLASSQALNSRTDKKCDCRCTWRSNDSWAATAIFVHTFRARAASFTSATGRCRHPRGVRSSTMLCRDAQRRATSCRQTLLCCAARARAGTARVKCAGAFSVSLGRIHRTRILALESRNFQGSAFSENIGQKGRHSVKIWARKVSGIGIQ